MTPDPAGFDIPEHRPAGTEGQNLSEELLAVRRTVTRVYETLGLVERRLEKAAKRRGSVLTEDDVLDLKARMAEMSETLKSHGKTLMRIYATTDSIKDMWGVAPPGIRAWLSEADLMSTSLSDSEFVRTVAETAKKNAEPLQAAVAWTAYVLRSKESMDSLRHRMAKLHERFLAQKQGPERNAAKVLHMKLKEWLTGTVEKRFLAILSKAFETFARMLGGMLRLAESLDRQYPDGSTFIRTAILKHNVPKLASDLNETVAHLSRGVTVGKRVKI